MKADAAISEFERQILLNDKLAGKLGIRIEDVGEGLWSLRNDPKIRKSERAKFW